MTQRIRLGLIFGGQSGEHEVSLASATSVLRALDPEKYEVVPIGITRGGQWLIADVPEHLLSSSEITLELPQTTEAMLDVTHHGILPVNRRGGIDRHEPGIDVAFPIVHGPYGEDGTLQGLLELAGIPYVGAGVFASAASMDKHQMKRLFRDAGLPNVPWRTIRSREWAQQPGVEVDEVESTLGYPVFVKPCRLGSSVGISKARDREELHDAVGVAFRYDRHVIVEQSIDGREVEVSVLGNEDPVASVPGEIVPHHEFYDYEAKYTEGLADLIIPAPLSREQTLRIQDLAVRAFQAVDAEGLARVDFFIRQTDGEPVLNEINTMPGFTKTSMYPKLWEASGVSYTDLIDRLVQLAIRRHQSRPTH